MEMPHYWVSVPYANLEVAWDGDVPELTSPWGEHPPRIELSSVPRQQGHSTLPSIPPMKARPPSKPS